MVLKKLDVLLTLWQGFLVLSLQGLRDVIYAFSHYSFCLWVLLVFSENGQVRSLLSFIFSLVSMTDYLSPEKSPACACVCLCVCVSVCLCVCLSVRDSKNHNFLPILIKLGPYDKKFEITLRFWKFCSNDVITAFLRFFYEAHSCLQFLCNFL